VRPHPQTEFPSRGKLRFPYPGRFGRSIRAVIGRIPGHRTSNSTSFPPESPTPPTPIPLQANPVRALAEPIVNGTNTLSVDAGHEQSPARNLPACVYDTASRPELRTLKLTRAGQSACPDTVRPTETVRTGGPTPRLFRSGSRRYVPASGFLNFSAKLFVHNRNLPYICTCNSAP